MDATIKVIIKILAVPGTVLWTNTGICWSLHHGTTAITDVATPHILSNCLPASILHLAGMFWTVSGLSLHSLHLGSGLL